MRLLVSVLAVFFGCSWVVGARLESTDQLGTASAGGRVSLVLEIGIATCVFAAVLFPVMAWARTWVGWRIVGPRGIWGLSRGKSWLSVSGILICSWLPYWLFLWPGVTTKDSWNQIIQVMGTQPYSDHHPVAHTLALGAVLRPVFALTGNMVATISVLTLIQLVLLAGVTSFCLVTWARFPTTNVVRTVALLFYALNPLFGWHSVTLWKDMWLGAAILAFATITTHILWKIRNQLAVSRWWWVALFFAASLIPLMKKTGIYVLIPAVAVVAIALTGSRLKFLFTCGSAIVVSLVAHAVLVAVLDASPSLPQEPYSIPSQQISRVLRDNPEVVTAEDRILVERFYPGVDLGEQYRWRYNQQVADAAKNALATDELKDNPGDYWRLWVSLCGRAPASCISAAFSSTLGYWYPGPVDYRAVLAQDWTQMYTLEIPEYPGWEHILGAGVTSERDVTKPLQLEATELVTHRLTAIPLVGWLLVPGGWTWATLFLGAVALVRRQVLAIPAFILSALTFGTCLISPVYAEVRYAYAILLLLPLLAIVTGLSRPVTVVPALPDDTVEDNKHNKEGYL